MVRYRAPPIFIPAHMCRGGDQQHLTSHNQLQFRWARSWCWTQRFWFSNLGSGDWVAFGGAPVSLAIPSPLSHSSQPPPQDLLVFVKCMVAGCVPNLAPSPETLPSPLRRSIPHAPPSPGFLMGGSAPPSTTRPSAPPDADPRTAAAAPAPRAAAPRLGAGHPPGAGAPPGRPKAGRWRRPNPGEQVNATRGGRRGSGRLEGQVPKQSNRGRISSPPPLGCASEGLGPEPCLSPACGSPLPRKSERPPHRGHPIHMPTPTAPTVDFRGLKGRDVINAESNDRCDDTIFLRLISCALFPHTPHSPPAPAPRNGALFPSQSKFSASTTESCSPSLRSVSSPL